MIENICHFVFGLKKQTEEFLFVYFLSVYSCYLINKPNIIYFYYHYEPYGKWWNKLKKIPNIKFEIVEIPEYIGKKKLLCTPHKADIIRMIKLYEKGGIYLDIDTICVRPWKHLLDNDVVLGKEFPDGICNAIMMTKPKTNFFKIWIDNYEEKFIPEGLREASILYPYEIALNYPYLLTLLEPDVFFLPNHDETFKIFDYEYNIPNNLITLHFWESKSMTYINNINDWLWAYNNNHTLYAKIILNLINKYMNIYNYNEFLIQ